MTPALKPYPAYKDSGVPWLGQVPEHWEIRSLGSLISAISQRGQPALPLLSVVREKGVIPRASMSEEENHNFVPDDLSNYKIVRKGNLVINKMKAWQGSLGIAPMDGIVSPAYFVFDVRTGDQGFWQALLRSKTYVAFFAKESEGVRIGQWDLSIHGMKRIPVVVPPLPEQIAIVRFLDYMDRRIRRVIHARQRQIKLLEEYKQALIHQAVTGQIDVRTDKPYPAYKDSGVPWLGQVPEHWDIVPDRSVLQLKKHLVGKASTDYTLLSLTKSGIVVRDLENPEGKFPTSFDTYQVVKPGDIIFCLFDIDETPRAIGLSSLHGMITGAYTVFECNDPVVRAYVYLFYLAMDNGKFLKPLYTGLRKVITKSAFLTAKMPLPTKEEQTAIVEYLDAKSAKIDTAIAATRREIDLLREYRERLIADVVTGKVDVREVATQLPEESEQESENIEIEEPDGNDDEKNDIIDESEEVEI